MEKKERLISTLLPGTKDKRGKGGLKFSFLPRLEEPNTPIPVTKYTKKEKSKRRDKRNTCLG